MLASDPSHPLGPGKLESINMMAKRLRNQGMKKEEARQILKSAFAEQIKKDRKRLVNLIMTYTRTFWRKLEVAAASQVIQHEAPAVQEVNPPEEIIEEVNNEASKEEIIEVEIIEPEAEKVVE